MLARGIIENKLRSLLSREVPEFELDGESTLRKVMSDDSM